MVVSSMGYAYRGGRGRDEVDPMVERAPDLWTVTRIGGLLKSVWGGCPGQEGMQVIVVELGGKGAVYKAHNEPQGVESVVGLAAVMGSCTVEITKGREKVREVRLEAGDALLMEDRAPWKWAVGEGSKEGRRVLVSVAGVCPALQRARRRIQERERREAGEEGGGEREGAGAQGRGEKQRREKEGRRRAERGEAKEGKGVQLEAGAHRRWDLDGEQKRRLVRAIKRKGAPPLRCTHGVMESMEGLKLYWQEQKGMTKEAMVSWWEEVGGPGEWVLLNVGRSLMSLWGGL